MGGSLVWNIAELAWQPRKDKLVLVKDKAIKAVATGFPLFQRNQLPLAQEKSKYYNSKPLPRTFHFSSGISCFWHRKSRNITVFPVCERKSRNITHITHGMPRLQSLLLSWLGSLERISQYCVKDKAIKAVATGFPLFQRKQLSLTQEKSKYHSTTSPVCERKSRNITNLTHDMPQPDCERKSRNFTNIIHGMPGPRCPLMNGKVEISHI